MNVSSSLAVGLQKFLSFPSERQKLTLLTGRIKYTMGVLWLSMLLSIKVIGMIGAWKRWRRRDSADLVGEALFFL
ncbi:hypothetical protein QBE54_01200 [Thermatribacter velox]|uniref:Uncharacterized protein n=1 Tax=Thermatribacter velox TaxID=3039681 RepID=A0ABZ2YBJ4_9BACT